MHNLLEVLSFLVTFGALCGSIYYFNYSGRELLKIRKYARSLQARLQPIASTLKVQVSTLNDDRGTVVFYTFPDGGSVSLSVGEDGFNIYGPMWPNEQDRKTKEMDTLMAAICFEYEKANAALATKED
jgi:hypothetical protein